MLVKGCQGKVIRVKSAGSRLFDEAFFVLRGDAADAGEGDMLAEANRILEENMLPPRRRASSPSARLLFFALGFAAASVAWLLLLLVLFV
ncbi:MAG: hypothetical protein IJ009_03425 [Clostridia bacterium]|nr:hypothetical protein [Clostridia bacterium]